VLEIFSHRGSQRFTEFFTERQREIINAYESMEKQLLYVQPSNVNEKVPFRGLGVKKTVGYRWVEQLTKNKREISK